MIPSDALILLDTNILVHLARKSSLGKRLLNDLQLLVRPVTPLISFVTLAELYAFGQRNGWGKQKLQFIETVRMNLTVVPIERDEVLRAYVQLDTYTHRQGLKPGKNDLWIAATAAASGAYLLTADRDFEPLASEHLNLVLVDAHTGERLR